MSSLCVGLFIHEYKPFAVHKERKVPRHLRKAIGEYSKTFIGRNTPTPVAVI
jgi:hypothetical protein